MPLNTWDLVLKPEFASKLKACGIYMLDSPEDLFPGVLAYLGLNPDSKRTEDLNKAGDASSGCAATSRSSTPPSTSTRSPTAISAWRSAIRAT